MRHRHHDRQRNFARRLAEHHQRRDTAALVLGGPGSNSLAAWFLGPKAENQAFFEELIGQSITAHCDDRQQLYPDDPPYVTEARRDAHYHAAQERLRTELGRLLEELKGSVPFFSYRYQAHMNWDLTIPGLVGYFAAMLYNQNNVALEASPVTARLEKEVGADLCTMLGFAARAPDVEPWGHITCDGSIANLEGLWVARNLRYFGLSVAAALRSVPALGPAQGLLVALANGTRAPLVGLDSWTTVNLPGPVLLELPQRLFVEYGIDKETFDDALEPYLLQSKGLAGFLHEYAPSIGLPVLIGTSTKHYSWPKNAAILGIGKDNFINVAVDERARMDVSALRVHLDRCLAEHRPVLCVVVVLGSTEESAVDPLAEVLRLREDYREAGLDFHVHVDAAWGGYFASILREPVAGGTEDTARSVAPATPVLRMSDYVTAQYEVLANADTVTIDPHKAGYIPYPAGALCYRDKRMRNLVAFAAPEVSHGGEALDANMGIYGVEGSKPGAAAAAVYLSHQIIRPDRSGYGVILGQALFNSKRFYAALVTMAQADDLFVIVPVQRLPAEADGPAQLQAQIDFIRARIVAPENDELAGDDEAMALLEQLGSDQIIITYAFNFKLGKDGPLNRDPALANAFNQAIFEALSLSADAEDHCNRPVIITTSQFTPDEYGEAFVTTFMRRLGLDDSEPMTMNFLSSTTMDPWLTATASGNFIPKLIRGFHHTVKQIAESFQPNHPATEDQDR